MAECKWCRDEFCVNGKFEFVRECIECNKEE